MKKKIPLDIEKTFYIEKKVSKGGSVTYYLMYTKNKTPRGRTKQCGYLRLYKDGFIDFVEIDEYLRGKGLGMFLYESALKDSKSIGTVYHQASDDAQRIWRKLCAKYSSKTDFFDGTIILRNIKKRK